MAVAEPQARPAGPRTVVVVEDDAETREIELFLLTSEGYRTVGVTEGTHAAEVIAKEQPDLVLLDLMLPGKDGNEILVELGADPRTRQIPVIVFTAYAARLRPTPQVRRVVTKPFGVEELIDAVAHELRGAR